MYSVAIKIEALQSKKRLVGLFHLIVGFFLMVKSVDFRSVAKGEIQIIFFAIGLLSLIYGIFRKKLDPNASLNKWFRFAQAISFIVLGIQVVSTELWTSWLGLFLFAIVCLILQQTEKRAFDEPLLTMNEEGLRITSHLIAWEALTEVVVREDFITVFHKEKKYLQYQVMQNLSTLEVAKMNAYCKEKIVDRKEFQSAEENKEGENS